jgi:SAM-dependent methyltransferase
VLDLGAGTGRNALFLARRGHPVDAVELVPGLGALIGAQATEEKLPVRVIVGDLFEVGPELGRDYRLVLLGGVAADFREPPELGRALGLAADRLAPGGYVVLGVHVARPGYEPDETARQWAQQCCAMFFTSRELAVAIRELGLELVADDSAHDYEATHLPEKEWPPTPSYAEWALGQHMFALGRAECPIELRWLVYRTTRG